MVAILVSFVGGINYQRYFGPTPDSVEQSQYPETATVTDITDGDTVKLDTGHSLRLVAISAPERDQPFGQEASDFLTEAVKGKEVRIEYEQGYEDDAFGRLLAYVFLNDQNINLELIRNGMAEVTIYEKRRAWMYQDELLAAQAEAQEQKIGIWAK